jgi:hypothetical protein
MPRVKSTCRSADYDGVGKYALQMAKRGQHVVPCPFLIRRRLFRLPGRRRLSSLSA